MNRGLQKSFWGVKQDTELLLCLRVIPVGIQAAPPALISLAIKQITEVLMSVLCGLSE